MQVELHPSLFADPSSQVSLPSIVPLPQTEGTGVHVSGFVNGLVPRTQVNPTSSLQVEEHPFPDSSSPSSHSSGPSFFPSPQTLVITTSGVHVSGSPRAQVNPSSISQVEEHPSSESLSPSSHYSEPSFIPLPHLEQTD